MEQISLYLDLKPGQKADFEVVGRAAAAFAETVKEIAFILDPSIEVKLEFDSGTASSLSLNALLKGSKGDKESRATLIAIIVLVGGWFVSDLRTYGFGKFLDRYLLPEQRQQLSDEDIERIVKRLKDVDAGKIAKEPVQEVYRQIERDEAITHVGTIPKPGTKPFQPVPREQFPQKAGIAEPVETSPKKRTKTTKDRLTLISPVLIESERFWKFRNGAGDEHGYAMKDQNFKDGILSGRRRIPMKAGIQITATVETHETKQEDVWAITDRWITEVHRVHRAEQKPDLFATKGPNKRKKRKR